MDTPSGGCKRKYVPEMLFSTKGPGVENPGDAMTKYLMGPDLRAHVARMHLAFEEGRAEPAPELTTAIVRTLAQDKEVIRSEHTRRPRFQRP